MDTLFSLSLLLKEAVRETDDEKAKEILIFKHLRTIVQEKWTIDDFPKGLDWFNTKEPLNQKHLKGKLVILDFFTYCCINCLHVLPHLRALEENFSVGDGLVVIGVHSAKFDNERDSSNILAAIKRYNITHPVVNDKDGILWNTLDIACWPTLLFLSPDGQPVFALIGEGHKEELLLYAKCTLNFFKSSISSHSIPLTHCDVVVSSNILSFPSKISSYGNLLAVSDSGHHRILILDSSGNIKFKVGGTSSGFIDGTFETARFYSPQGVVFYDSSKVYVADTENHAIRLIDIQNQKVSTIGGTGSQGEDYFGGKNGLVQEISSPWDVCIVTSKDVDATSTQQLVPMGPILQTSGGSGPPPPPPPPIMGGPPPPPPPSLGKRQEIVTEQKVLLIAMSGTHQIWAYFLEDTTWWKGKKYKKGTLVAIAGNGKEENRNNRYPIAAGFAQPSGLTYSPVLKAVLIADSESSSIRMLSLKDGSVNPVVGADKNLDNLFCYGDLDGKGYDAKLQHPLGLTWNPENQILYVCDTYNHKIKEVDVNKTYSRSIKLQYQFNEPSGCCVDSAGNIYVADTNNHSIIKIRINDHQIQKLEISEEILKKGNAQFWESTVCVKPTGGAVSLRVKLQPDDVHGRWKIDCDSPFVKVDSQKGDVNSENTILNFNFLPSDLDITVAVVFDLVFCQNDACVLRKYVLRILVKRLEDAAEKQIVDFSEIVR